MKENIKNKECNQCGKCCANVLMLSPKEITTIKSYIEKNNIPIINHNTIFMQEDANICPFLEKEDNGNTKCNIYPVRPSICRSYNCSPIYNRTMNYDGVQAINMLFTFGGYDQFSIKAPDLSKINERIKELQKKIKKSKKQNKNT